MYFANLRTIVVLWFVAFPRYADLQLPRLRLCGIILGDLVCWVQHLQSIAHATGFAAKSHDKNGLTHSKLHQK